VCVRVVCVRVVGAHVVHNAGNTLRGVAAIQRLQALHAGHRAAQATKTALARVRRTLEYAIDSKTLLIVLYMPLELQ